MPEQSICSADMFAYSTINYSAETNKIKEPIRSTEKLWTVVTRDVPRHVDLAPLVTSQLNDVIGGSFTRRGDASCGAPRGRDAGHVGLAPLVTSQPNDVIGGLAQKIFIKIHKSRTGRIAKFTKLVKCHRQFVNMRPS